MRQIIWNSISCEFLGVGMENKYLRWQSVCMEECTKSYLPEHRRQQSITDSFSIASSDLSQLALSSRGKNPSCIKTSGKMKRADSSTTEVSPEESSQNGANTLTSQWFWWLRTIPSSFTSKREWSVLCKKSIKRRQQMAIISLIMFNYSCKYAIGIILVTETKAVV